MDYRSTRTTDIEASIKRAYDADLQRKEREQVRRHLAFALAHQQANSSLIEPIRMVLNWLDAERALDVQRSLRFVAWAAFAAAATSAVASVVQLLK